MVKLPSLGAVKSLRLPGAARRASGVACINIWPDRVDVSRVTVAGKGRPEIMLCDSYRKLGGDAATLNRLRRELKLDQCRCTTLLKSGEYQMMQVEAPGVLPGELKNAVRWRIKDMIDFPVDEATVDAVLIPGEEGGAGRTAQALAVAARNQVIAATIKPFNDADIPLEVIDVPEFAQRNIAKCFEAEGRGVAALSLDDRGGLLTFTSGGELYQHRRIDVTLSSLSGAGAEQKDGGEVKMELEGPFERELPCRPARPPGGDALPLRGDGFSRHRRAARARAAGALPARDRRGDASGGAMSGGAGIGGSRSRRPVYGDATVEPIPGAPHRRSMRATGGQIPEGPSSAPRRAPFMGMVEEAAA
jgi:MSHA biogenesis protein MshI